MAKPAKPTSAGDSRTPLTLRERAEALARASPTEIAGMATEEVQRLIHELRIHRMELEIQNEDLRAAQLELAEAHDRFADLYDFAPVGYLTLGRTGIVLEANLTAAQILQRDRQQVLGAPLSKYLSQNDADLLYLHLFRTFANSARNVCDLQLSLPNGMVRTVRLESVETRKTEPRQCRTIMSDITELSQAQEAVQRSARLAALGTLAAGIAHEVNNPLWMITLQAEVALTAEDRPERDEIVRGCLREIRSLAERGGRIVTSVLRFANGDVSHKWANPIASWLTRARDLTRNLGAQQNIVVELDIPDGAPSVLANPTEMEQVFVNLLTNAIEASQPASRIHVSASWNADTVTIRVEDEGCGISPDQITKILDPFYTTRRETGATGLGLNVAHRIVEDHGGTIELVSQLEKGTTVSIRLPLVTNGVVE